MSWEDDKILRIFLERLNQEFGAKIKKTILFGSRARGDHAQESDYDLLLVFEEVTKDMKETLNEIEGSMLYEYNTVFSAFALSEKDLKKMKYEPFILNAQKEGKVISVKLRV